MREAPGPALLPEAPSQCECHCPVPERKEVTSLLWGLGSSLTTAARYPGSLGWWEGAGAGASESLKPRRGREHMLSNSPLFLQKNLLINLNHRESSNLLGMAAALYVGFLCLAVID